MMITKLTAAVTAALILMSMTSARADEACPPHPYPCGDEWPVALEGPFDLREVRHVMLPSHDGVPLEGWIGMPDVPAGVRVPVVLHSSPYLSRCSVLQAFPIVYCSGSPADDAWWTDPVGETGFPPYPEAIDAFGVAPRKLVERGYAVAFFNVRGTGGSGGCLELWGPNERADQAFLVSALGGASWSNGNVAMIGMSYPGTTPVEGAVEAGAHLKTIVPIAPVTEASGIFSTPQGARTQETLLIHPFATELMAADPWRLSEDGTVPVHRTGERVCDAYRDRVAAEAIAMVTDDRGGDFYEERRLLNRLGAAEASVLLVHGMLDDASGHWSEDSVWTQLGDVPKRAIFGRWGHCIPSAELAATVAPYGGGACGEPNPVWALDDWTDLLTAWFDYWLKGVGAAPGSPAPPAALRLGIADYQDTSGAWHASTSWPPATSRDEVVHLAGGALAPAPGDGARSYRAGPVPIADHDTAAAIEPAAETAWCTRSTVDDELSLTFVSEPMAEPTLIAGNPFAYLRITSDQPGGVIAVHLLGIPAGLSCTDPDASARVRVLSGGAADLRFHAGSMVGTDFPIDQPTPVRIDLWNLAETLQPGERLAVVVGGGDGIAWRRLGSFLPSRYQPRIAVHGDSHVVVPMMEGTLGGQAPSLTYPPRPFLST